MMMRAQLPPLRLGFASPPLPHFVRGEDGHPAWLPSAPPERGRGADPACIAASTWLQVSTSLPRYWRGEAERGLLQSTIGVPA